MDGMKVKPSVGNGGDTLELVKGNLAELADDVKAKGEALLKQAQAQGRDLFEDAQDSGLAAWKDLRILAKKHQGPAIVTAMVTGLLFYAVYRLSRE